MAFVQEFNKHLRITNAFCINIPATIADPGTKPRGLILHADAERAGLRELIWGSMRAIICFFVAPV
jgi:hypothetical protein